MGFSFVLDWIECPYSSLLISRKLRIGLEVGDGAWEFLRVGKFLCEIEALVQSFAFCEDLRGAGIAFVLEKCERGRKGGEN